MKERKKRRLIYLITIACSVLFLLIGSWVVTGGQPLFDPEYNGSVKAKVEVINEVKETEVSLNGMDTQTGSTIYFEARLLSGESKGQVVYAMQTIDPYYYPQPKQIIEGDKVLIFADSEMDPNADWIMMEYVRTDALLWLGLFFAIGILLFGHMKGVNTIVSLAFTCLAVFMVFVPAVLDGRNIYFWAILVSLYIILMTMLIVYGANRKSLAAGLGCFAGTLVAGVLSMVMDLFLHLTGMLNDESLYLTMLNGEIDLKAIIFGAIIIGAIGAIMDVSMSIASSLEEISQVSENPTPAMLIKSGLSIGRDIMGTMANTLVLAYIGSSLSVVLLLVAHNGSLLELLNRESIIVEILQALAGSIGILMSSPLTSFICAFLLRRAQKKDRGDSEDPLRQKRAGRSKHAGRKEEPKEKTLIEKMAEELSAEHMEEQ